MYWRGVGDLKLDSYAGTSFRDYHNLVCGHGLLKTTKFASPDKTKGFEDYGKKPVSEKRKLFPLPSSKTPIKTSKIDQRLYNEAFRKQVKHGVLTAKYMNELCPFSPAINKKVPKYLEKFKMDVEAKAEEDISAFLDSKPPKPLLANPSDGFQNVRVVFDQDISEIKIDLEDEEEKERFENLRQLLLESQRANPATVSYQDVGPIDERSHPKVAPDANLNDDDQNSGQPPTFAKPERSGISQKPPKSREGAPKSVSRPKKK